jgi:hypothetical protein
MAAGMPVTTAKDFLAYRGRVSADMELGRS